jgi:Tfp pilus assembly protein PilF
VKQGDELNTPTAQAQLELAIQLDPHLGDAYLQLGILQATRKQFASAVASFEKAIEYTPYPDEAHYHLAEVYRRTGETGKARQETALYKQISEQKSREVERERHEIQQFVYTLSGTPPAQTPASHPH